LRREGKWYLWGIAPRAQWDMVQRVRCRCRERGDIVPTARVALSVHQRTQSGTRRNVRALLTIAAVARHRPPPPPATSHEGRWRRRALP
jgi:hypothetical protein